MKFFLTLILLMLVGAPIRGACREGQTAKAPEAAARRAPLRAGEVAPDFTLEDEAGKLVSLADARGRGPVVLVFYRGWW